MHVTFSERFYDRKSKQRRESSVLWRRRFGITCHDKRGKNIVFLELVYKAPTLFVCALFVNMLKLHWSGVGVPHLFLKNLHIGWWIFLFLTACSLQPSIKHQKNTRLFFNSNLKNYYYCCKRFLKKRTLFVILIFEFFIKLIFNLYPTICT